MDSEDRHPERDQMLMAARSGRRFRTAHLERCEFCEALSAALRWLGTEAGYEEPGPPGDLLRRHKSVPLLVSSRRPARTVTAERVLDTWTSRPALSVRQAAFGVERRIRFAAAPYEIEFVANRQLEGWELAVRVYEDGAVTSRFVLNTGRRRLSVGCGECFVWTSPRPPRRLELLSPDLRIRLENLPW